jgi:hypothetical protein
MPRAVFLALIAPLTRFAKQSVDGRKHSRSAHPTLSYSYLLRREARMAIRACRELRRAVQNQQVTPSGKAARGIPALNLIQQAIKSTLPGLKATVSWLENQIDRIFCDSIAASTVYLRL